MLYPDPVDGYPTTYARDELPQLDRYPDGPTLPSPRALDFTLGALLGSTSGELGLRKFLEAGGHEFVVTADKDGPGCAFERELPTAEVVISQPFWPAYLTAERIARAPKLKLAVTAGIGSDHVDLAAASQRGIIECWFGGQPIRDEYLIVEGGKLAGTGARSYTVSAVARELAAGRK
jgi:formate dehydrogenase